MESDSCGGVDEASTDMLWEAICDTNAHAGFNDDLKIYELAYSSTVSSYRLCLLCCFGAKYEMEIRTTLAFNDAARRSLYVKLCN